MGPIIRPSKPDILPDYRWRNPMKNFVLAAFAALSLTAAIVPVANAASSVSNNPAATSMQQTGTLSR
jgi:hypothetical protein